MPGQALAAVRASAVILGLFHRPRRGAQRNACSPMPTFCYYSELSVYGACRMCVVEDERGNIDASCSMWRKIAAQDPAFGRPDKFCCDPEQSNWMSATVTTLDSSIPPYIQKICKRDPFSGKVVTGGIVTARDSNWLMSWTLNRQPQFRNQPKGQLVCWVYGLFSDKPGNFVKKAMPTPTRYRPGFCRDASCSASAERQPNSSIPRRTHCLIRRLPSGSPRRSRSFGAKKFISSNSHKSIPSFLEIALNWLLSA